MIDTARPLNDIMEFDHVVQIHPDGSMTERDDLIAPDVLDSEMHSDRWSFVDGYSGQHGYSGPIMHESEYIGGGMERDLRDTPGVYVALVAYYTADPEIDGDDPAEDPVAGGWAVARLND